MRFLFPHSHAFQRGRVTVDDDQKTGPGCLVEFGDGFKPIEAPTTDVGNLRSSHPLCDIDAGGLFWRI